MLQNLKISITISTNYSCNILAKNLTRLVSKWDFFLKQVDLAVNTARRTPHHEVMANCMNGFLKCCLPADILSS